MSASVVPFSSPLQFTTLQTFITEDRWLCTANQDTWGVLLSVHLKMGGLDLREGAEPGEWWHRQWQPCWQRGWRVKEVLGDLPSHACCSWSNPLLSWRRGCSDDWGKGKGRGQKQNWGGLISAWGLQQEVCQQTSGTPQLEDPPTRPWAHPKPHVLSTPLSPHCHQPFYSFKASLFLQACSQL